MENQYVMNEYVEVIIKQNLSQLCSDCYRALGWNIINTNVGVETMTLKMQRDRKIRNRTALCDLQRKCEDAFIEIEKLEKYKLAVPMGISIGTGILGTVFMAGAVFSYLASNVLLCTIIAIPAFFLWGLPYFLFKKLSVKSSVRTKPLVDQKYDEIYETCEKARQYLLN